MNSQRGYKDLLAWQIGMDLVQETYILTKSFPSDERFGLSSQMRRAAVSIPSNISEGYRRRTNADFLNFLHIAFGSAAELETQSLIALRLKYFSEESFHRFDELNGRLLRVMSGLIRSRESLS